MLDENEDQDEDDSEYKPDDGYVDSHSDDIRSKRASPSGMKMAEEKETGPKAQTSKMKNQIHSTTFFSPMDSPTSPSPTILSPKSDVQFKKENPAVLRLLSRHIPDSSISTSLPLSPPVRNDHSFNSADSDGEVIVGFRLKMYFYPIF